MTPDMEMRITARNRSAAAFADVRKDIERTGRAITPVERHAAQLGSVVGTLPAVFNAAFAGISVASFASAMIDANRAVADMSRQARTANVEVERFQQLLAGVAEQKVDMASLAGGLREMQDKASEFARDGGGRAAEALQAIGFSSEETAEALKAPDRMFLQIIDRIGELDRASQIRFLGDIFGNAEGDKFLKLLQGGSAAIEQMGAAAVANGDIIEAELVGAAEEIEKKFDRMLRSWQVRFQGFAVGVSDWMSDLRFVPQMGMIPVPSALADRLTGAGNASGSGVDPAGSGGNFELIQSWLRDADPRTKFDVGGTFDILGNTGASDSFDSPGKMWKSLRSEIDLTTPSLSAANKEVDIFRELMADIKPLLEEQRDPFDQLAYNLNQLDTALAAGRISWEQYGAAVKRANMVALEGTLSSIGQITGVLAGAFQDNKMFAVANAVVNTAEGITKALAQGGMFAWPTAIAIGAAGAAQIATILSAQPGSSKAPAVSGNAATSGGAAAGAGGGNPQSSTVILRGHFFFAESVADLLTQLIKDGGGTGLVNVIHEA